ncbi:SDR family oxidoreductase [Ornithinibacillus sp. BX22]|uniref:SDR family oxidoreductase n=1 Tax=Ornithinibacillus hominis TaxID=2763055 RepID=A0A923L6E0_9BACI|nr:SDR family oxidoreductase [Ornithinibacillus hominis]MBC5637291.1 SDR family oxidoreductase [Ornithinibacillus hominis]
MSSNKMVAIVTGGASGIGKAICMELVENDVYVIIVDINESEGNKLEKELNEDRNRSRFVKVDVTSYSSVHECIHAVYAEFGRLDYLFNNAGIAMYGELDEMSITDWEDIIDINVWGVVYGTQIGYSIMKKQGFGYLVNTASAAGLGPSPISSAYATTKHAIVGLTTSLHYEAKEFGVNVTTLCPAFVDTPIFDKAKSFNINKSIMKKQLDKQKLMSPNKLAKITLNGVHKNKPVVCPMLLRNTMDIIFTIFPPLHNRLMDAVCKVSRKAKATE